MNEVQVVGTHNSYHIETTLAERKVLEMVIGPTAQNLYYSHASIPDQLTYQSIRGLEIDLWADSAGGMYANPLGRRLSQLPLPSQDVWKLPGTKVLHVSDFDVNANCHTLVECLTQIKQWSKANKGHVLLPIMLEFKVPDTKFLVIGGVAGEQWNVTNLENVDKEIRSVFNESEMITPDDIRRPGLTLEQSLLKYGWPTHNEAKGQVMFLMDNDPATGLIRNPYRANGHSSLENRVIFTHSRPGEDDGAFLKRNDPRGDNLALIQDLVKKGYYVRTRSDEPIDTVLQNNFTMREAAYASGAQLISTDFPVMGMSARYNSSFVSRLPGGATVRCNPLIAGKSCSDKSLEKLS